jgi:hypothetical protein
LDEGEGEGEGEGASESEPATRLQPVFERPPKVLVIVPGLDSDPPDEPTLARVPVAPAGVWAQPTMNARAVKRPARWPTLLCAFLAGINAGFALVASPLGHTVHEREPEITRLVKERLSASPFVR